MLHLYQFGSPNGYARWLQRYGPLDDICFDGPPSAVDWGDRFWRGFHEVFQQYQQEMSWPLQNPTPVMLELPEAGIHKAKLEQPKSPLNPGSNKYYPVYSDIYLDPHDTR